MRLLITGADGQLGQALQQHTLAQAHDIIAAGRHHCDLTDQESVAAYIADRAPDAIVNAAAYTAVDRAESDADAAYAVNADGAGYLAQAAAHGAAQLIHISTDYVFSGDKSSAYHEDDPVGPLGVYGRSKWAGEQAVRAASADAIILRTAWVFSAGSGNFVTTMLRLGRQRRQLAIVDDQWGSPTSANDIADAIWRLLALRQASHRNKQEYPAGTIHFTCRGDTNWYEFAQAIFAGAQTLGYDPLPELRPISTADYGAAAPRPQNSRLDCGAYDALTGDTRRHWRDSLAEILKQIDLDQGLQKGSP